MIVVVNLCCNNSTETKTSESRQQDTSFQDTPIQNAPIQDTAINIPEPTRDYHSRESDVIENFFLFVNSRDWTTANSFYADSITISNRSVFFRKIMEDHKYVRLNLGTITPIRNDIHVHTNGVKPDSSSEESCFRFRIENLKIVSQMQAPCIQ